MTVEMRKTPLEFRHHADSVDRSERQFHGATAGFTLVEILIVVAIIAVLAAIALPTFSQYRVRAYNASARTDMKNFRSAMEAYVIDHDAYPNL